MEHCSLVGGWVGGGGCNGRGAWRGGAGACRARTHTPVCTLCGCIGGGSGARCNACLAHVVPLQHPIMGCHATWDLRGGEEGGKAAAASASPAQPSCYAVGARVGATARALLAVGSSRGGAGMNLVGAHPETNVMVNEW